MIRFCRARDEPGVDVIDMRVEAEQPFCRLSFDYQHGQIPVPGLKNMYAESVTGAFEGLRLIGKVGQPGKINCGYFVGAGRPRELKSGEWCAGHSYRGRSVNLSNARRYILVPAYLWVLANKVPGVTAKVMKQASLRTIGLYDGYVSADLNAEAPLSAAAIMAAYLNGALNDLLSGEPIHDQ